MFRNVVPQMVQSGRGKCKCPCCERCDPKTATSLDDDVPCGRECPGCLLFRQTFGKNATFKFAKKVYRGCTTCMIVTAGGRVLNRCNTCFSDSCGRDAESCPDFEFPLEGELRMYKSSGGRGLSAGHILKAIDIEEARKMFERWGPDKSLAHLTPEGAEGSVNNR